MTELWQSWLPEPLHEAVGAALAAVHGGRAVECLGQVGQGASGAVGLHLRSGGRDHVLRAEVHRHPARSPHHYRGMAAAAEAGLAPALHYLDADNGVAVMDFIRAVPLERFPGGRAALVRSLGRLAAELQRTPAFPELWDFRVATEHLLGLAEQRFEPGLLAPHRAAFERLRDALAWDPARHVSSHNDPNPRNVLFDGERLWLIDWETACRNEPMVDVAILADTLPATAEERGELLAAWLGRPATTDEIVRLAQVTMLTRLYYAGLLFAVSGTPVSPMASLEAPSPAEFAARVAGLAAPSPEILLAMAKMRLRDFLEGCATLA
jgi:aminoglycoside phosphotransferase (APT) family kinase protein